MRTVGIVYPVINIHILFSTKRSGKKVSIVLFYNDLMMTHFVMSFLSAYTLSALLINCPMHGEFPSDAWIEMNVRVKAFSKVKKMYFFKQQS